MDFRSLVLAGLLPGAICAAVLLAVWKPALREWGGALGFGLAFTLGAGFLLNWPSIPPKESWQWLIYIGLLGMIPGLANCWSHKAGVVVASAVAVLSAWLIVPVWQEQRWWCVPALGAAILILSFSLDPLARRWPGAALPLLLFILCCSAMGMLLLSGNVKFALLAFITAACCGVSILVGMWCPSFTLAGGAAGVFALLLPCLLFNGYVFNESKIPTVCFIVPAFSPIAAWISQFGRIKRLGGWKPSAISVIAVLIPIAICGILVYRAEFS